MTRCENPNCKRYIGIGESTYYCDHRHICQTCYDKLQSVGQLAEERDWQKKTFWIALGILGLIGAYLAFTS